MYFYLRTFKEGLYEGQELSVEQFIIEPKKGLKLTIHKEDLDKRREGYYPLEIQIVDFDDKSIAFKQYDQLKKVYGSEMRVSVGETIECQTVYAFMALTMCYSTAEIYLYFDNISYLEDVSRYNDVEIYGELFNKVPEYKEKLFPKLLKEGNINMLYYIYKDGLVGEAKDDMKAFCYLVKERDYAEFLKWYNSEEVQVDLKNMDHILPSDDFMSLKAEYAYWTGRYMADHHNEDCLEYFHRPLVFFVRDGYYDDIYYTQYLTGRDIVKYVVDNNQYEAFKNLEETYEHGFNDEEMTLWIIYGCYLAVMDSVSRTGEVTAKDIYIDVSQDEYDRAFKINWATPQRYVDKDMALAYVREAAKNGDKYAIAILDYYQL